MKFSAVQLQSFFIHVPEILFQGICNPNQSLRLMILLCIVGKERLHRNELNNGRVEETGMMERPDNEDIDWCLPLLKLTTAGALLFPFHHPQDVYN